MDVRLPPLHWLSPALSKSQFLPGYARLKRGGKSILVDGLLDPPLHWIHGTHTKKSTWFLPIYAYELLRRSAVTRLESNNPAHDAQTEDHPANDVSSIGLSPHRLLESLPRLQWPTLDDNQSFFSPRIAIDSLPDDNFATAWIDWIFVWVKNFNCAESDVHSMLADPYALIRGSYRWICELLDRADLESEYFAAALTAFSLGALGAFPRLECDLCFRLAVPQRLRCEHHLMAMIVHGGEKERRSYISQSARAGKKIARRCGWDRYRPIGGMFLNSTEEPTVAEMLWGFPPAESKLLSDRINMALSLSPIVRKKMPFGFQDLPLPARLAILRDTLDAREWISKVWPEKIFAAQEWISEFNIVAPGRAKGPSLVNQKRLQQVDVLLAAGVKKSEIAQRLGISPSHLSKILSRRPI